MRLICALLALAAVLPAAAAADAASRLTLSGFGTLGYIDNDNGIAEFARDLSQPARDGVKRHLWPDSRLGMQLNYRVDPRFELGAQLVLRDQANLTAARTVEWAFAAFHPRPALDLRAGRLGLDVFLLADYRNVGYAYLWVRPVTEFYSWMPIYSFDGADASYAFDAGGGRWRLKLLGGRARTRTPSKVNASDYDISFDPLWGGSASWESGPWRAKFSYVSVHFDSQPPTEPLTDALAAVQALALPGISADAGGLQRELTIRGTRSRYAALGASYDDNLWLAQAEYSVLSGGPLSVPQGWRGYLSLGRRFGDFTPYAVTAWARPSEGRAESGVDWSALPGGAGLQGAALTAINLGRIDQHTVSLGTRWDFSHTAALKLQWDHTRVAAYGWGLWLEPPYTRGGTVNLFTATLDWVF